MSEQITYTVDLPEAAEMGPAMRALNERQRSFVYHLSLTGGDQSEAYVAAGYQVANHATAKACASRLANTDAVANAIQEEALRTLKGPASLVSIQALLAIVGPRSTAKDGDKIKAANSLLDRVAGFAGKTEHTVVFKDERTTNELIDFIRRTAKENGLDAQKLLGLEPVDAEFEEVAMSSEGLEDVL